MKVCYVDESGNDNGNDPCLIMVGVVVDVHRLNRTRAEFAEIFDLIQRLFKDNLKELKGSKMIFGRDRWRKVDPDIRKRIAEFLCGWVVDRKHHLALAAIDRARLAANKPKELPLAFHDEWLAGAMHIALQLQKHNQGTAKNKGNTFLILDDNKQKADPLSELLWEPDAWTDSYYGKGPKQERLDQIIDTTFSIKSHHAGLVQVADLFAFLIRRYAEMHDYGIAEAWKGERALIDGYVSTIAGRMLPRSTRWPARTSSACAGWYNSIAPDSLKALGN